MKESRPVEPEILVSSCAAPADEPMEIVERKGLGHPDTICDAVMESVAVELAQSYLSRCGRILHFNADKGMLVAGQATCRFGAGAILVPMRLIIGDRATFQWKALSIPVKEIAERAAYKWFKRHLPRIEPVKHLECQVELRPTSEELRSVAERPTAPVANDTSAVVGYAPFTPTERLVFQVEQFLNSPRFKKEFPDTGEDVKVLAVRHGTEVALTVAMPFLATHIRTETRYFQRKKLVIDAVSRFISRKCGLLQVRVFLNALDRRGSGAAGSYLSVLGTSAEGGDSGEVGRGNRVCGVISVRRPASAEAAAGKHPLAHVGKIYNVLAHVLAEDIHRSVPGLRNVTVWLTSQIGQPIADPHFVMVEVIPEPGFALERAGPLIRRRVSRAFADIKPFCLALARGAYRMC